MENDMKKRNLIAVALVSAAFGLVACSADGSMESPVSGAATEEDAETLSASDKGSGDEAGERINPSQSLDDLDDDESVIDGVSSSSVNSSDEDSDEDSEDDSDEDFEDDDVSHVKNVTSGDYSCNVTRTSNSVKVDQRLKDVASRVSTVSGVDGRVTIKTELWYADASDAAKYCDQWEDAVDSWDGSISLDCSGNTINITTYDDGDLYKYEDDFKDLCDEMKEDYDAGEY